MVPEAGLEPAHHCWREILNLLCLPISPLWHCVQAYRFLPRIQNSLLILNFPSSDNPVFDRDSLTLWLSMKPLMLFKVIYFTGNRHIVYQRGLGIL